MERRRFVDVNPMLTKMVAGEWMNDTILFGNIQQEVVGYSDWDRFETLVPRNNKRWKAVGDFLTFIQHTVVSDNPYNNKDLLRTLVNKYGIIETKRFISVDELVPLNCKGPRLTYGRESVGPDHTHIMKQLALTIISNPDLDEPIVLDRKYRIIDGLQRIHGYKSLSCCFNALIIDYEHEKDIGTISTR